MKYHSVQALFTLLKKKIITKNPTKQTKPQTKQNITNKQTKPPPKPEQKQKCTAPGNALSEGLWPDLSRYLVWWRALRKQQPKQNVKVLMKAPSSKPLALLALYMAKLESCSLLQCLFLLV